MRPGGRRRHPTMVPPARGPPVPPPRLHACNRPGDGDSPQGLHRFPRGRAGAPRPASLSWGRPREPPQREVLAHARPAPRPQASRARAPPPRPGRGRRPGLRGGGARVPGARRLRGPRLHRQRAGPGARGRAPARPAPARRAHARGKRPGAAGPTAPRPAHRGDPGAALLGGGPPGAGGVARAARRAGVPILFKPFRFAELLARVRTLLADPVPGRAEREVRGTPAP